MGELLADHTTLRLGGPADRFLTHTDPAAWPEFAHVLHREGAAPFVLGGGSNTLAADTGHPGTVLRMATRGTTTRSLGDGLVDVVVHAGEPLASLVAFTVAEGLSGIEYLGGIPGTTGAAPVQNTGAYGQQISDTLALITAHDWHHGHTVELRPIECNFGYRTSLFKTQPGRWTILTITLRLTRSTSAAPVTYRHLATTLDVALGTQPPLTDAAHAVLTDRAHRGLTLPTAGLDTRQAGSVFLNPPINHVQAATIRAAGGLTHRDQTGQLRASAGWLLEQTGHYPGSRIGPGVYCSTRRTLTLTARGGATSKSFSDALHLLTTEVEAAYGIKLHPEPVSPPTSAGSTHVTPAERSITLPS
ncbi:UDP-N-acetylmuramate dehydrogenase [Streptomyces sp. NPDC006251]|uniref:UDP-N-acetylmuramate dehydrogenase n=1 Tax=Streptomyces sp. NPDC006251 TaxID=3155718 RepID=UPI0033B05B0F